ncbi:hypothetical protein M3672_14940 [Microbacterium enclense]|uniref:hypothetical protein n=1 Tax=Microbacterium enclense TaxID=993073 RepID=UPI002040E2FA|nr:hypothetical protein [Microbacterium enclense]MCM3615726.1 hypothetical protein [Microbacterium enclense]
MAKKKQKSGVSGNPAKRALELNPLQTEDQGAAEERQILQAAALVIAKESDPESISATWDLVAIPMLRVGDPKIISDIGTALLSNLNTPLEVLLEAEHLLDLPAKGGKRLLGELVDRRFDEGYAAPLLGQAWTLRPDRVSPYIDSLIAIVARCKSEARLAALWPFCAHIISTFEPLRSRDLFEAFEANDHTDGGVLADVMLHKP